MFTHLFPSKHYVPPSSAASAPESGPAATHMLKMNTTNSVEHLSDFAPLDLSSSPTERAHAYSSLSLQTLRPHFQYRGRTYKQTIQYRPAYDAHTPNSNKQDSHSASHHLSSSRTGKAHAFSSFLSTPYTFSPALAATPA